MQTIRDYIDVMFKDIPNTKKFVDIKMSMLETMETKYADLTREGKNEQEALATVISQFGNIDELKRECEMEIDENVEYLPSKRLAEYKEFKKVFSVMIGVGVAICILALSLLVFFEDTELENIFSFGAFVFVAVAVAIFIIKGLESSKYSDIAKARYRLEARDEVDIQREYELFRPVFNIAIALGVILCIMGVGSVILIEGIFELGDNIAVLSLFMFAAGGVFLFIMYGIRKGMYDLLLNLKSPEEKNYEWLYDVTMPIAVAIFLYFGFVLSKWHPAWVVFPATALLTAAMVEVLERIGANK